MSSVNIIMKEIKTKKRSERVIEQNCVRYAYTFSLKGKDYEIPI